jgi:NADH-quinone oxidoreductase subunit L
MFTMAYAFGTLEFSTLFALTDYFENSYLFTDSLGQQHLHTATVIGILLFIGAVGKSAQLGLHT